MRKTRQRELFCSSGCSVRFAKTLLMERLLIASPSRSKSSKLIRRWRRSSPTTACPYGWATASPQTAILWFVHHQLRTVPKRRSHPFQRAGGVYALHIYAPAHVAPGVPNHWGAPAVSPELLLAGLGPAAEPRLHTLAALAMPSSISAVRFPSLMLAAGDDDDEWMLPCAPGVVLGDAAHPPVPASVQAPAMALEDAAVLAKLFSHLRRRDQIPSLLGALATLRAERTRQVLAGDAANIMFTSLEYGADGVAEARDASMRALTKAGRQAIGGDEADADSNEQWSHIITTWAYGPSILSAQTWTLDADGVGADAEDDADDWWASWGVIGERAQDAPTALAVDFGESIVGVTAEESTSEEDC
jgi:hypothetical protein